MDTPEPPSAATPHEFEWRIRNGGVLAVAHLHGKPVAGVSGPWSGKFALTWWERPLPARQLELFETLDDAKREVERWAERMRSGATFADESAGTPHASSPRASFLQHVRGLLPEFGRRRTAAAAREEAERLRHLREAANVDVDDLHFAAYE